MSVLETLEKRGFIEATTHDAELRELLSRKSISCYIGFDPTATSFHVGSLVPIMALAHMQRQGHRPIALIGGGTGLVGDPSGKTEMRRILTEKVVEENAAALKQQLSRFIDFDAGAMLANNADWLVGIRYIPFLREIGPHFHVNRMIKAESYRQRLESEEGLSFLEFNYMLLQAYDFMVLYEKYDCRLQMGGSDQWGNIVAGVELIRRKLGKQAYGITFPLITTAGGAKMGKTAQGAIWLDAGRTSPYDYYQFWVNTHDEDVHRFLSLFTFLPMEEVDKVKEMSGEELNSVKAVLAYEATELAHGQQAAVQAHEAAMSMFGARTIPGGLLPSSPIPRKGPEAGDGHVPSTLMEMDRLAAGIPAYELFHEVGLAASRGQARRLIEQGGAYVNGERVEAFDTPLTDRDLADGSLILRAGKKRYHRVVAS
ncbi:MAG: tyrosine--tRNA ligase [Desulfatibacillaceae bacterium]